MKMTDLAPIAALASLTFGCCACSENDSVDGPDAAPGTVRVFGTVHAVMQGDWKPVVSLQDGLNGGYGLGALSELRGEFVALPGQIWLSYPTDQAAPQVKLVEQTDEQAALLVAANVPAFREASVTADIPSASLDQELAHYAERAGVDVSQPFPFLVRGQLRAVQWHVVDGTRMAPGTNHAEAAQKGTLEETEGTIVGFYSSKHQGVFTMQGQNTHMHVVAEEGRIAGHVDSLDVPAGSSFAFP